MALQNRLTLGTQATSKSVVNVVNLKNGQCSVVNLSIEKELALFNGTLKLVRCGSQKQVTTGTTEILQVRGHCGQYE